jgi:hypothetical protein
MNLRVSFVYFAKGVLRSIQSAKNNTHSNKDRRPRVSSYLDIRSILRSESR